MPVIYRFFSLWGNASQLMFCLVCWVVMSLDINLLIPLDELYFGLLDWGQRLFLYPFIREDIGTSIGTIYKRYYTPGVDLAPASRL